jgi:acetyl-CoA carboxylase biotin carboxyl carrier protein
MTYLGAPASWRLRASRRSQARRLLHRTKTVALTGNRVAPYVLMMMGGSTLEITSPLAGEVLAVNVAPGDLVEEDQDVAVLSSMKIEIKIKAECSGRVAEVLVTEGAVVDIGSPIIRIERNE